MCEVMRLKQQLLHQEEKFKQLQSCTIALEGKSISVNLIIDL